MRGLFQKSIIKVALEEKIRFNKQIQGRATKILHCEGGEALEKLPRETVDGPCLHVFKVRLHGALEQPDLREGVSVHDREVETR